MFHKTKYSSGMFFVRWNEIENNRNEKEFTIFGFKQVV